jgi:hypothetical protein
VSEGRISGGEYLDLNGRKELEAGGQRKLRSEELHILNSSTNITDSVTQTYQKSRNHLKTLGVRRVTRNNKNVSL